jgi:putative ABC transport system permease protein
MRVLRSILFRLRALFDRRALDDELSREFGDHIERETKANIAGGMSPGEARRAALAAFGGLQQFKEETRAAHGASWLEWLRDDARIAVRSLVKSPAFTATVVVTLALGVGANAAVFSLLNRIYLQGPAGIAHGEDLRRLYEYLPPDNPMNGTRGSKAPSEMYYPWFDHFTISEIRAETRGHAEIAAFTTSDSESVGTASAAVPVRVAKVSDNYFSVLGVRPAHGRFFAQSEGSVEADPGVAVLTDEFWQRAYGSDPAIVGRTITLNKASYVVIGVAPVGFTGTELNKTELFLPIGAMRDRQSGGLPWYKSRIAAYFHVIARVSDANVAGFKAAATVINRRFAADLRGQVRAGTVPDTSSTIMTGPIVEAMGPAGNPKEYAVGIRVAGVAAIVLLIACANIANLLLIRSVRRRHEVAVRLSLGVPRRRLIAQFLTEGAVLAAGGGLAAVLVAAWGGSALRAIMLPTTHWATPALDVRVLVFTLAVALIAGIAAALLPALQGSQVDIVNALKSGSRGRSASRTRSVLLVLQTALSLVLIVGAGLFVRSLRELRAIRIGYVADELAFAWVDFDEPGSHAAERLLALPRVAERIAALPGVRGVALASIAPMRGGMYQQMYVPGRDSAISPSVNLVSSGFFAVTGMRIIAGRALTADDRRGEGGSLVINEAMAKKYWPGASPLGQCVRLAKPTAGCSLVAGVAENGHRYQIVEQDAEPQYFAPLRALVDSESTAPRALVIRTQPGGSSAVEQVARAELRQLVPNASGVTYMTMAQSLAPELRPWRLGAYLFTAFGILALLVATVGIYGVIAYSFSQRTHELGIRAALGASARDTYQLVLRDAITLTAAGVAAGIVLALALGKFLASLLYATSARDPLVLSFAALILIVAGVAASILPAWRASQADPMTVLRAE